MDLTANIMNKTINVVSTPNIEGNIGSCTSNAVSVDTGYNMLTSTYKTIVTNSCTGQVTTYDSWSLGAFPWVVVILGIVIVWTIFAASQADKSPYRY